MKKRAVSMFLCMAIGASLLAGCNKTDKDKDTDIPESSATETSAEVFEEKETDVTSPSETTEETEAETETRPKYEPTPEPTKPAGLVKEEVYDVFVYADFEQLRDVIEYQDGKIIRETSYDYSDFGTSTFVREYTYDSDKLVSVTEDLGGSKTYIEYAYDGDNLISKIAKNDEGKEFLSFTYEYENGILVKKHREDDSDGHLSIADTEYFYDELGYPIKEFTTRQRDDGETYSIVEYRYNEKGDMTYKCSGMCDKDGFISSNKYVTIFIYDENGNREGYDTYRDGRIKKEHSNRYVYNEDGTKASLTVTSEEYFYNNVEYTYSYDYDDQGRLIESSEYWSNNSRDHEMKTVYYYE